MATLVSKPPNIPLGLTLHIVGLAFTYLTYYIHDSVVWVYSNNAGTSWYGSRKCYWWIDTGTITVNTSITKTSSFFDEQRGAWHGPGESLWRRTQYGWLVNSRECSMLQSHTRKKHRSPQMYLFIVGDGQNRVPADDVCGVITLHVPSARSSGSHVWCHIPGNACLQNENWHAPDCNFNTMHQCKL